MRIVRPCLACGHESGADAAACDRCGVPLVASAASVPLVARAAPSPRRVGPIAAAAGVVAALGAAAWWFLARSSRDEPVRPALEWREPKAVEAWASGVLGREGAAPGEVEARVVPQAQDARRAFLTRHPDDQPLPAIAIATARLLLAARSEGPSSAAHLAVIRQADRTLVLPVGEAASVASDRASLARWLGISENDIVAPPEPAEAGVALTTAEPAASAPAPAPPEAGAAAGPSAPASATAAAATGAAAGPPARIARGHGTTASKVVPGQAGVPLLRVQVAAGARRTVRLRSITVKASGALDELTAVAWVDLWREADASGRPGVPAQRVGERQSFDDDDGRATFDGLDVAFGEDGLPLPLLVSVDLADESEGGAIELSVPDASAVAITDAEGEPLGVAGAPVTGSRATVVGNVEPDPEQQRLDALASEGPDAVDPNVERMRTDAMEKLRAAKASGPAPAKAPQPAPQTLGGSQPRRK